MQKCTPPEPLFHSYLTYPSLRSHSFHVEPTSIEQEQEDILSPHLSAQQSLCELLSVFSWTSKTLLHHLHDVLVIACILLFHPIHQEKEKIEIKRTSIVKVYVPAHASSRIYLFTNFAPGLYRQYLIWLLSMRVLPSLQNNYNRNLYGN